MGKVFSATMHGERFVTRDSAPAAELPPGPAGEHVETPDDFNPVSFFSKDWGDRLDSRTDADGLHVFRDGERVATFYPSNTHELFSKTDDRGLHVGRRKRKRANDAAPTSLAELNDRHRAHWGQK